MSVPSSAPRLVVGVDFGGTNLKAGICDETGRMLCHVVRPTHARDEVCRVLDRIADLIALTLERSGLRRDQVEGVALAACGLVDRHTGEFIASSVLPAWQRVPLAEALSERTSLAVRVDNDANAAIFGEWWQGVGRGTRNLVGMTLGTGIGGGVVLDSRLFFGSCGNAGEFGHMTIEPSGGRCFCGNRGCLGLLASATGLVERCQRQLHLGRESQLAAAAGGAGFTAEDVYRAAVGGDSLAQEMIEQTGRYLGIGAANLLSIFNPDMVVFVGGMTGMGDRLLSEIRREATSRTYAHLAEAARIEFGILGDYAGLVGAAGMFFHHFDESVG